MARVLDASLVHVPYEELAQASRESRAAVASDLDTLMRSISALSAPADGEASSGEADSGAGSSGRGVSANEARQVVSGLVEQINRLKRKVDEGRRAEAEGIARCRSRIACLLSHSSAPEDGAAGGGGARLADARCDRFVADYLLRTGRHHSASETSGRGVGAAALCASANGGVAALLDERNAPPLTECRRVTDALLRQDAGPALQWCERERHRLAKLRSPLEPQLRLQHFLALVAAGEQRRGAAVEAVEYARRHLQPAGLPEAVAEEARRGMALLALGTRTSLPHASLLDPGRLATRLPSCQRSRSAVTCRLSGTLLDEDNPPLVLPSGHAAVLRLEAAHGGGAFRDPRTDDVVTMGSLRRAYFL
ncbi:hypothetical protein EMIHUDRAFT_200109 [Emiliania huxleyi CCMP1516]|uniref:CTLH domain-containing protein n=2 Tax=Emiliania huxleyi TaxID=2903 RepID=A0A0D3KUZ5_EMIH1|nr:hypothetical protein EMIHUDRAFT_200109 [Emiliania huxleyi CCMP1516]EOD39580.1 hypothetical protein EMIHUDRAFT_200109 [Emiliania huxleyi CCMP1516]|eukprot:XP_005792009.1 hypothetical protein EMIHUDRAFT_200109 [Emiliania huxleyi CCMP1516]